MHDGANGARASSAPALSKVATTQAELAEHGEQNTKTVSSLWLALILAAGVVAASSSAIFARLADAPGVVVAAYRMSVASLLFLPWTVRAWQREPLNRRGLGLAVAAGVFLGMHFATWISSLSYTSVAISTTLVNTNPLWVTFFMWIFAAKRPAAKVFAAVCLAIMGGVLIAMDGGGEGSRPFWGNSLALLGALTVSAYFLLGRAAQRSGLSLQAYAGLAYATAALVLLPMPALLAMPYSGYPPLLWLWIVLMALVPQLLGHTSFNYALKYLDPTLVSTVILLEPLGASLLAVLLFSEFPSLLSALGALVLLAGVLLTVRYSPKA